jgi:hypothetical protein
MQTLLLRRKVMVRRKPTVTRRVAKPRRKPTLTLYLAGWQKRMIKDFVKPQFFKKFRVPLARVTKMNFKPGLVYCPASYKIPFDGIGKLEWVLYLTDEQIHYLRQEMKITKLISSVNITEQFLKDGTVTFK